ncbi:MAG: hypothetical protein WBA74_13915, partial [Cyclobacteriaceae bacterium]
MISLINTWNKEFVLFSLLNTMANYRETRKILKGEFSIENLEKLTSKDGGRFKKAIERLQSAGWLIEQDGFLIFSTELTDSNYFDSVVKLLEGKINTLAEKRGVLQISDIIKDTEPVVFEIPSVLEGIIFAPVFHFLASQKPAQVKRFLSNAKNEGIRNLLLSRKFLLQEAGNIA